MKSPSTIPCRFCHKPPGEAPWSSIAGNAVACVNKACRIYYISMSLDEWEAGVVMGVANDRCNIIHPEKLLNPNQPVLVIPLEES